MSKDENFPTGSGSPLISRDESFNMLDNIQGKMLTIIDASISEIKQREAVKSLVRMSLNDIRFTINTRWHKIAEWEDSGKQGSLEPWLFTPESGQVIG
jgi:hypothetical protein